MSSTRARAARAYRDKPGDGDPLEVSLHESHDPVPTQFSRAFGIGVALNAAVVAIETFYGWRSGSLALLADAGHNLSDVGGLGLAWAALALSRAAPDARHTYGWRRGTILASFFNAMILILAMGALAWEAIARLRAPSPPAAMTVIVVATIGAVVNAFSAWLFKIGRASCRARV